MSTLGLLVGQLLVIADFQASVRGSIHVVEGAAQDRGVPDNIIERLQQVQRDLKPVVRELRSIADELEEEG